MKRNTRFLLTTAAGAAVTANTLKPIARKGFPSVPAFSFGLPTSELPLQALAIQAAAAAVVGRKGGVRGAAGALGVVAAGASFAGLAQLQQAGIRSEEQFEAALRDGLGEGYRKRITEGFALQSDVPLTRKRILMPDFSARKRYRVERDIPYGEHGERNMLDVWRRRDVAPDAKNPVLFQVHGGAWVTGMKEGQAEPLMGHLAERGWVCVAPNYRLSPRATWPEHIVDVKRALAWVKQNIAQHGGDPDFVVITGGSAGGHLCALTALTPNRAEWQPGFEDVDTSVVAAVPFYGVYDFTNHYKTSRDDIIPFLEKHVFKTLVADDRTNWEAASPVFHIGPDAPPMFVLHGVNDSLVPVEQARTFVEELRRVSNHDVVYAELPLAQHAFDILPSARAHHSAHAVERFLAVVRSEHER